MKRVFLLCLLTAGLCARTATAVPLLDQYQLDSNGSTLSTGAQTFTPGITGYLHHIDLWAYASGTEAAYKDITFSLVNAVGSVPSDAPSDLLATTVKSIPTTAAEPSNWRNVAFPADVWLTSGEQYAIIWSYMGILVRWNANVSDPYTGGSLCRLLTYIPGAEWEVAPSFGGGDAKFKTYMVPEPATLALFGLGSVLIGVLGLRRRLGHCRPS